MLTRAQYEEIRLKALEYFDKARIMLTEEEKKRLEVVDFGFGYDKFWEMGLVLFTYFNTKRCCAKDIVCFPGQYEPEHYHPEINGEPGKEETFRCRYGTVYLYVPGEPTPNPKYRPPAGREAYFKGRHEVILKPGDQYFLDAGVSHWFTTGPEGAVISEFSTASRDEFDVFSDPEVDREVKIV
jgi:D-lyxose ketol-isomerase